MKKFDGRVVMVLLSNYEKREIKPVSIIFGYANVLFTL